MKKSSSAPSLVSLGCSQSKCMAVLPIRRANVSCNALINMTIDTPQIETGLVYLAKVPLTQAYSCLQAPDVQSDAYGLATCMAAPPEPVEEESYTNVWRHVNPPAPQSLDRYQIWYNRMKTRRNKDKQSASPK